MTLRDDYEAALNAWRQARSLLLSDRLTRSRKEAQMQEALVEQDEERTEYFAERRAQMQQRVAADEARVATLAARAEEARIAMVTEELDDTLAAYDDLLREMAAAVAALDARARAAGSLAAHAEQLAGTLPQSAARQHHAANTAAQRTHTIETALRQLNAALIAPP